jgi:hypothetical protein
VWIAVAESEDKRRRPRWGRRLVVVTVAGAGAFVALNAGAREAVLGLVTNNDSK